MSTESGVAAPPKKASSSWVIWVLVACAACFPIVGILAALSIYGVRKYLQNARRADGQHVVLELATLIARCAKARATGGAATLPATAEPVPRLLSSVSARKYMSSAGDWSGDAYTCAGFAMRDPQYFQYQWEKLSETQGRVTARADLDGNSVADSEFEATVSCSAAVCSVGPVVGR
jgi:hypothetical protein